jgi:diguanylate cyclase (GGDEF)-like protein
MEAISIPQSFFEKTSVGLIIVNLQMRPVFVNDVAARLMGISLSDEKTKLKQCERFLINNRPVLEQTPDFYYKHESYDKTLIFKERGTDRKQRLKVFYSIDEEGQICIFMVPMEPMDSADKRPIPSAADSYEPDDLDTWRDQAMKLYEYSAEELMLITPDLTIEGANPSIRQQDSITHCYEYLGNNQPCADCPVKDGDLKELESTSVGHHIAGEYITETIAPFSEGNGAMLTFGKTTEQIGLLEKINSTQTKLKKKQLVLSSLVELALYMQSDDTEENIFQAFMEDLVRLTEAEWAIILANGERKGSLWMQIGSQSPEELPSQLAGVYLKESLRETGFCILPPSGIEAIQQDCEQVPLKHGKDQVGLLIVKGKFNQEAIQLMSLFAEPLELFISNRMLMKKLDNMEHRDSLTRIFNRNYLLGAFEEEASKSKEHDIPFSIIICNINGIKEINDTKGQKAGDTVIASVAQILFKQVRNTDVVARLGSDEFAILAPNTNHSQGKVLINKIKSAVSSQTIQLDDHYSIPVSLAMGSAGTDIHPSEELMKVADQDMYLDKEEYYKSNERYR